MIRNATPFQSALRWERSHAGSGRCEIRLAGYADLSSASVLASLESQLREETSIVLHVAELEFADTTFLRFLLRLRSLSGQSRSVTLVGVTSRLMRILEVTGLSRIFPYEPAAQ